MKLLGSALVGLTAFVGCIQTAVAEDDATPDVSIAAGAVVSNLDAGGEVRFTVDLNRAIRLGLRTRSLVVRQTYVAGFKEDDGFAIEALPYASLRLIRIGDAELRLRLGVGVRSSFLDTTRDDTSTRLLTEMGPMIWWHAGPDWTFRLGWIQRSDIELSPTTDLAVLGQVFRFAAQVNITGRWAAYGEAELGGVFGYGGDNEKIQARGVLGLRVALDPPTKREAPVPNKAASSVGAFVALEWRALALDGHFSHGPGISAGVRLFDGLLKIGVTGFGRPGPLNPETFDITPAGGVSYKGQDRLTLRSDGAFFGLLVESELPFPGVDSLRLVPSLAIGNAGFGFYLTGDDRQTPDGRRVSAWEDELQDGKDAGVAMGIEPGLRIAWQAWEWLRPYLAVRYLLLFDYEAFAQDNYNGLSAAGGIEFVF